MTRTPFMLSLVAASLMMGACKKDPEPMAKQPAEPMVEEANDKPTVIALREIADGLVDPERVDVIQAEIEAAEAFESPLEEDDFAP